MIGFYHSMKDDFYRLFIFACCVIFMVFVVCGYFSKLTFSKISFRKTLRVSNGLDPDVWIVSFVYPFCMLGNFHSFCRQQIFFQIPQFAGTNGPFCIHVKSISYPLQ